MSIQAKTGRVRPEIMHIEYKVEVGDAIEKRELPFLMGVMSDLSGQPKQALPSLANREFVDVDRDSFGKFQKDINPRLDIQVDNKLKGDGTKISVEMNFPSMEHFSPAGVARQVPALRELLELRQQLAGLVSRVDGKEEVTSRLEQLLREADKAIASTQAKEGQNG